MRPLGPPKGLPGLSGASLGPPRGFQDFEGGLLCAPGSSRGLPSASKHLQGLQASQTGAGASRSSRSLQTKASAWFCQALRRPKPQLLLPFEAPEGLQAPKDFWTLAVACTLTQEIHVWRPAKAPMRCGNFRVLCRLRSTSPFKAVQKSMLRRFRTIFRRLDLQKLCRPHPVHQSKRFTYGGRPRPPLLLCAAQSLLSESPKLENALCGILFF